MYLSNPSPSPTAVRQTYETNSQFVTSKIGGAQCRPTSTNTCSMPPIFFAPAMAADSASQAMPGTQKSYMYTLLSINYLVSNSDLYPLVWELPCPTTPTGHLLVCLCGPIFNLW